MTTLAVRFESLATDDAPGQEVRRLADVSVLAVGERLTGKPVDFSHGDVDAFQPAPGAFEAFAAGVRLGGSRAYTEYRGDAEIRDRVASSLSRFTGAPVSGADALIITPGTQGALFLALGATVSAGDKVAIVRPDYFANRKLVQFLDGEVVPVTIDYLGRNRGAGLDLDALEAAFRAGVKTFVFSNPNNPAGIVYSRAEIDTIARLANRYGVTVIVDQLYARLAYTGTEYTHLRAADIHPDNVITIMGPSKTESLSGYRVGVAFGSSTIVSRMEKLQAVVSLRASGYSQSVLQTWFAEPDGWLNERIRLHQSIRDDLHARFAAVDGVHLRMPEAGSYVFPRLPRLTIPHPEFVRLLRHQAEVIVTPGTEFSPHAADSIRLNFSQAHDAAAAAVTRIAAMIERYRA